jgi:hypothetical protein
MSQGNKGHGGWVLSFIGAFDLHVRICLRCLNDVRHQFRDATRNFSYKLNAERPDVGLLVQEAARPLNSVWMGGPEEKQRSFSPKTERCIL